MILSLCLHANSAGGALGHGNDSRPDTALVQSEPCHPLDRQLEQATEGLGPSTATAAIYAEFEAKWDRELNQAYRALLADLPVSAQVSLREAQRLWLKFRDADVRVLEALGDNDGHATPTMYQSALAFARMNLTRERALCLIARRQLCSELAAGRADIDQ
ncbi:MAG: DUF1311 domain-containing protein [Phycisphaerae bacterium]|nr:DUF1311 domain-containing protein [Phycisphaerae bacterium]